MTTSLGSTSLQTLPGITLSHHQTSHAHAPHNFAKPHFTSHCTAALCSTTPHHLTFSSSYHQISAPLLNFTAQSHNTRPHFTHFTRHHITTPCGVTSHHHLATYHITWWHTALSALCHHQFYGRCPPVVSSHQLVPTITTAPFHITWLNTTTLHCHITTTPSWYMTLVLCRLALHNLAAHCHVALFLKKILHYHLAAHHTTPHHTP